MICPHSAVGGENRNMRSKVQNKYGYGQPRRISEADCIRADGVDQLDVPGESQPTARKGAWNEEQGSGCPGAFHPRLQNTDQTLSGQLGWGKPNREMVEQAAAPGAIPVVVDHRQSTPQSGGEVVSQFHIWVHWVEHCCCKLLLVDLGV